MTGHTKPSVTCLVAHFRSNQNLQLLVSAVCMCSYNQDREDVPHKEPPYTDGGSQADLVYPLSLPSHRLGTTGETSQEEPRKLVRMKRGDPMRWHPLEERVCLCG